MGEIMKRAVAVMSTLVTILVAILGKGITNQSLNWESVVLFGLLALSVRAWIPSEEEPRDSREYDHRLANTQI
jgi:hypothetical protein